MAANPAASKFVLTRTPALPGKCAGCGNDAKGDKDFVDMNLSLDYYGAVVFCIDCASEISNLIGFVDPVAMQEMDDDLARALVTTVELTKKVEALESVVSAYDFSRSTISDEFGIGVDSGEDENQRILNFEKAESGPFK